MPETRPPTRSRPRPSATSKPSTGEAGSGSSFGGIGDAFTHKYGPLPGWAWAGIVGAAGAAILVLRRRRAASGGGAAGHAVSQLPAGWADEGGGGGYPGGSPGSDPGGEGVAPIGSTIDWDAINKQIAAQNAAQAAPGPSTNPSPLSASSATGMSSPFAPGGAGNRQLLAPITSKLESFPLQQAAVVGGGTITNQIGSSYAQASPLYQPSALDLATERLGGLSYQLQAPVGSPGQTSTVYTNFTGGTGPVVPVSQRIAGERYDTAGRVIL